MAIIGFNFTRMLVESKEVKGRINVNNNVAIKSVEKFPLTLGTETQDTLRFNFEFTATYEPKAGRIDLLGHLTYLTNAQKTKEIYARWQKEKKIDKELMVLLLNNILQRCNVECIILSKEMNLPPTIPMPRISVKQEQAAQKPSQKVTTKK